MNRTNRRAERKPLTAEHLRQLLSYDPATGLFHCLQQRGTKRAGDLAGTKDPSGYVVIEIDHRRHYAHRLAFLHMTGEWPHLHVDHRDRNRANNAWSNLRDVPRAVNQQNISVRPSAGAHRKGDKWRSSITANGKTHNLGVFQTAEAASAAYLTAKAALHGT